MASCDIKDTSIFDLERDLRHMCRVRRGHVCACHERPLYCDYTGDFECLKRKMFIKKVVYKESCLCGMRPSCDGVFGCGV